MEQIEVIEAKMQCSIWWEV